MSQLKQIQYSNDFVDQDEMIIRLEAEYESADRRRSVRMFSRKSVPKRAIELAIQIAGTAPSGAHRQPWYFVAISNEQLKEKIREIVEKEERDFYENRAPKEWLEALKPLGTDFEKKHITDAPWIIVVFRKDYELSDSGVRLKNYYMTESVSIAIGFFLQAIHKAGLVALTHTPAPMTFLREICGRPTNEKPLLLIPVGYPAKDCKVPDLVRKKLEDIAEFRE